MSACSDWLKAEAKRQGLSLDDEDLEVIGKMIRRTQEDLVKRRPKTTEGLHSPFCLCEPK